MSQAASQAWAFYREVAEQRAIWTVRDNGGFPAPVTQDGRRAQPFWSSRSRVERIIENVSAYEGFEPYEISWSAWCEAWVPGLTRDSIRAGVNWSGSRAVGHDLEPVELQRNVQALIDDPGLEPMGNAG